MLSPLEDVLETLASGGVIVLLDDDDRENEGDLVAITELITPEILAFMTFEAKGLICTSISPERAKALSLPLQSSINLSPFDTPFTTSLDHISSLPDSMTCKGRSNSMRMLIRDDISANEFKYPGYVFPLSSNVRGVLGRRGQTEGSYDLARLAGVNPSGVICEILNKDGTVAKGKQISDFAKKFKLPVTTIQEIESFRRRKDNFIRMTGAKKLSINGADYTVYIFEDDFEQKEHLALVLNKPKAKNSVPLLRIHSECFTGDLLHSRRCDCGPQLTKSIQLISERGFGGVIYLRQEGRGIGLANKIKAYSAQDKGLDTVDANLKLGFKADARTYEVSAMIFKEICSLPGGLMEYQSKINGCELLTNNPRKIKSFQKLVEERGFSRFEVKRKSLKVEKDELFEDYLKVKRSKLGHLF